MLAEQTRIEERTCNICNQTKEISEFHRDRKGAEGYRRACKTCRTKERRKHDYITCRFRKHSSRNGSPIEYTDELIVRIRLAKTCQYCGCMFVDKPLHAKQLTIDHVYNDKINTDYNSALICRSCNSKKKKKNIYEFYQSSEAFTEELYEAFLKDFHSRILKRDVSDEDVPFLKEWSELVYREMTGRDIACLYLVND